MVGPLGFEVWAYFNPKRKSKPVTSYETDNSMP